METVSSPLGEAVASLKELTLRQQCLHEMLCVTKDDFQNLTISAIQATILSNSFAVGPLQLKL